MSSSKIRLCPLLKVDAMELWLLKWGLQVPRQRRIKDKRKSSAVQKLNWICASVVGRNSAVGVETRYGVGGPVIESRWGPDFPRQSRLALWPTKPPIRWVPALFRGKANGAWRWPPTPFSDEVKERVELYLYSPSGYSFSVLGRPLPLCAIVTGTCSLTFITFDEWLMCK